MVLSPAWGYNAVLFSQFFDIGFCGQLLEQGHLHEDVNVELLYYYLNFASSRRCIWLFVTLLQVIRSILADLSGYCYTITCNP